MSYTKIVYTIGPNSLEEEKLVDLYKIGLRVARLNVSHANLSYPFNGTRMNTIQINEISNLINSQA